jgi:hypothetical protein
MIRTHRSRTKEWVPAAGIAGLLLFAGACTGGRPEGEPLLATRAGELGWSLWLDPDPPRQEGNTLWVEVRNAAGEAVEGAEVTLGYLMPAMGAMAEMRGKGDVAETSEGLYRIDLDFPVAGTWGLTLALASDGTRASAEYSLTIGRAGLREIGTSGARPGPAAGPP